MQFAGACGQARPEFAVRGSVAQQQVEIGQVAQAMRQLAVVEQMGGGMQNAVFRRQHIDAGQAFHRDGAAAQLGRVGMVARGVGQDGVVHVDHGGALDVLHRGDLVHPAAVIALVVFRQSAGVPAGQHERGLGLRQMLARHQDVDVVEQPPFGGGQAGGDVGRTLEHDQRAVEVGQRGADLLQFPAHGCALLVGQRSGGIEMPARHARYRGRQTVLMKTVRQACQQPRRAGLPHQGVPFAAGETADGIGRAQGAGEQIAGVGFHAVQEVRRSARRSNEATASRNSP